MMKTNNRFLTRKMSLHNLISNKNGNKLTRVIDKSYIFINEKREYLVWSRGQVVKAEDSHPRD
jgi:hypothetical protein